MNVNFFQQDVGNACKTRNSTFIICCNLGMFCLCALKSSSAISQLTARENSTADYYSDCMLVTAASCLSASQWEEHLTLLNGWLNNLQSCSKNESVYVHKYALFILQWTYIYIYIFIYRYYLDNFFLLQTHHTINRKQLVTTLQATMPICYSSWNNARDVDR